MHHKQKHTRQLARIVTRPHSQCRHCGGGPNAPSATSAPNAPNAPSDPNDPSATHAPSAPSAPSAASTKRPERPKRSQLPAIPAIPAPIRSNSGSRVVQKSNEGFWHKSLPRVWHV